MSTPKPQKLDAPDIIPLIRYLKVLTEKYPRPLTPKQLSKLSGVSLAAVSKVRERLFPLCDVNSLGATRRALLLSNDLDTIAKVGFAFYMDSKLGQFLRTPYARTFIRKSVLNGHEKLAQMLIDYPSFLDKSDILFLEDLAIRIVTDALDHLPRVSIHGFDPENLRATILNQVIQFMDEVSPSLSHYLKDQETLEHILVIRDRLWYMTHEVLRRNVRDFFSLVLAALPSDELREIYVTVYLHTAELYLQSLVFDAITQKIREAANSVNVPWRHHYDTLGAMVSSSPPQPQTNESAPVPREPSVYHTVTA